MSEELCVFLALLKLWETTKPNMISCFVHGRETDRNVFSQCERVMLEERRD